MTRRAGGGRPRDRHRSDSRLCTSPLGTVREKLGAFPVGPTPFPTWMQRVSEDLEVGPEVPYYAWELVRLVEGGTPPDREALLALVTASLVAAQRGKIRVPLATMEARVVAMGAPAELGARILALLQAGPPFEPGHEILGSPEDPRPLILDGGDLVHQRLYFRERDVKASLAERLGVKAETPYGELLDAIDDVLSRAPVVEGRPRRLSTEQQHAIRTAASRRMSVIMGGPGSGKTTIVASLLRVLVRLGIDPARIALVAPTGKAARRVAGSVRSALRQVPNAGEPDRRLAERCPEPSTIHRLLASPARSELLALVVDEASMIDLELMERLLVSVPDDARIIFLGDPEQLPPIAPGAVFREMLSVSAGAIALGGSYRQDESAAGGRNIQHVARQVRSVEVESLFDPESRAEHTIAVRSTADGVKFVGVELLETSSRADRDAFVARWGRERIRTPELLDLARRELVLEAPLGELERDTLARLQALLDSQQILCVTNRDAARVNDLLSASGRGRVQPVIAVRSDRDRGRVNGESGMRVRDRVVFPASGMDAADLDAPGGGGFDIAAWDSLGGELALAFAITVHKSQGSEYDHVALLLPEPDHPLLTRPLLYTAITRARKSLTLVGSREAVVAAVGRSQPNT